MQEKTAHTLLGAFILSALAIAVVATLLVAGRGYDAANSQTVIMVFDGSVYGLNKGAPVAIRGANIGQVTDIRVRLQHADELRLWMEVEAVINRAAVAAVADGDATLGPELINSGLRAQLNNSSFLTGLLFVQLDFFPETDVQIRAPESDYLEIPTIPSPFDQLVMDVNTLNFRSLAANLQDTAEAIRALTTSDAFQQIPENTNRALQTVTQVGGTLEQMMTELQPQLEATLSSTAAAAQVAEQQIPLIADETRQAISQVQQALESVDRAAANAAQFLEPDSPTLYNLNMTLSEISRASRSLNSLTRSLEDSPQSLLLGRPDEEEP